MVCFALASILATQQNVVVHTPRYPNSIVKKGTSLKALADAVPGYYVAYQNPDTMPKIQKMSASLRKTFSGIVYVRKFDPKNPTYAVRFHYSKGELELSPDLPKAKKSEFGSIDQLLKSVPKGADIHYCEAGNRISNLELPKDIAKLNGFLGDLLFTSKGDSFWVGIKDGKVTYAKENLIRFGNVSTSSE